MSWLRIANSPIVNYPKNTVPTGGTLLKTAAKFVTVHADTYLGIGISFAIIIRILLGVFFLLLIPELIGLLFLLLLPLLWRVLSFVRKLPI